MGMMVMIEEMIVNRMDHQVRLFQVMEEEGEEVVMIPGEMEMETIQGIMGKIIMGSIIQEEIILGTSTQIKKITLTKTMRFLTRP